MFFSKDPCSGSFELFWKQLQNPAILHGFSFWVVVFYRFRRPLFWGFASNDSSLLKETPKQQEPKSKQIQLQAGPTLAGQKKKKVPFPLLQSQVQSGRREPNQLLILQGPPRAGWPAKLCMRGSRGVHYVLGVETWTIRSCFATARWDSFRGLPGLPKLGRTNGLSQQDYQSILGCYTVNIKPVGFYAQSQRELHQFIDTQVPSSTALKEIVDSEGVSCLFGLSKESLYTQSPESWSFKFSKKMESSKVLLHRAS